MKVAVLADIHSNLPALEKVLRKTEGLPRFCCGDLVGYNAFPNEVIDIAREENIVSIMGNHDHAVVSGDVFWFNEETARAIEWTAEQLSKGNLTFLKALPKFYENSFYMVHGSPKDPLEEYIYEEQSDTAFRDLFNYTKKKIIALGHTHQPFVNRIDGRLIFNPGSVGQPRDSDPRASNAVLDTEEMSVKIKRVEYDIKKTAEKVTKEGLPKRFAKRLFSGV